MKPFYIAIAAALTGAATLALAAPPPEPKSGIDLEAFDKTCKPCDDFWRHVNGTWLDKNPIPARLASWGSMFVMREANSERLRTILESAAASSAPAGSNDRKIGDFYTSCMDTAAIDAAGLKPIQPELNRIAAIRARADVARAIAALHTAGLQVRGFGGIGPFGVGATQDFKNSSETIAMLGGGGLSLPDRDYYFKTDDKSKSIRDAFLKHVAKMLTLEGTEPAAAASAAETILKLETSLAEATMTNVERRDPSKRYKKMTWEQAAALAPAMDWPALLKQLGVPASQPVNVMEPAFLTRVQSMLEASPIEDWKVWLRWRLLRSAASNLAKPFEDEDFEFEKVLTGVTEQLPRWQRCTAATDAALGDALGEAYVRKHFPPEAKRRMLELVENLRATLKEEIENSPWMAPETRKNAVAKLSSFEAKIGYADRWRDYSKVSISRKGYLANIRSAAANGRAYFLGKIGKPLDRNDWGMTPPTVNAYYNPPKNEIAFPAGILQPPMFDLAADDAANYGAIGAVIGHEMGHGFDDQGSKFDAAGNLKNWWTPQDREQFEKRAQCVVDQFNSIDVGDGLRHNGKLVVGEALGDLGGLTLALKAYQRSLKGKPAPVMEGYTPAQRFFIAFARVWSTQVRPAAMRLRLNTDPHPLGKYRANATLKNMPEFHQAFQCKRGDAMVRETQCQLW